MSMQSTHESAVKHGAGRMGFHAIIDDITHMNWSTLSASELTDVAWAYYYFSIQFRENLEAACRLHPEDERLADLNRGERDTDNISPWPGVAKPGEKMHHDEFMRRTLMLSPIAEAHRQALEALGRDYLDKVRAFPELTKAMSIASYEDGGLEAVFTAILKAPHWQGETLGAFKHFLAEHIRFDSDPDGGHGALCRHIAPDNRIEPLWAAFREILAKAVPALCAKPVTVQ